MLVRVSFFPCRQLNFDEIRMIPIHPDSTSDNDGEASANGCSGCRDSPELDIQFEYAYQPIVEFATKSIYAYGAGPWSTRRVCRQRAGASQRQQSLSVRSGMPNEGRRGRIQVGYDATPVDQFFAERGVPP